MAVAIFWFNLLAFSLMFGTLGLAWLRCLRRQSREGRLYLAYVLLFVLWFLALTFFYFLDSFTDGSGGSQFLVISLMRLVLSVGIAYVTPLFLVSLVWKSEQPLPWRRTLIFPLLTLAMFLLLSLWPTMAGALVFSAVFNSLIGVGSFWVLRSLEGERRREFRSFLWLNGPAFLLFGSTWLLRFFWEPLGTLDFSLMVSGLFMVAWSLNDILVFLKLWGQEPEAPTPELFFERYAISPREREIIQLLALGKSHKEIAAALFISPRTAESHVYRIFRKCAVNNRVELLNLLRSLDVGPL